MSSDVSTQIEDAYRQMAKDALYRPAAPSDGLGNISAQGDLDQEARDYAARYWADEQQQKFWVGCPNFPDRPALIWIIEAARLLNGGDPGRARKLLEMADAALAKSRTDVRI